MKILTILGTRPEFIRLSLIIKKLDKVCDHVLIHTGQNYDKNLNEVFFEELGIRKPNYYLGATGTFAQQLAKIYVELETIIKKEKPDKFLVLGDTNSSMGAVIAKRLHIPVYHMEAGNRCHDERVPEEVNRKIIDHSSTILMPYSQNSRMNLIREGIALEKILVTGNPIYEVLENHTKKIDGSTILQKLNLTSKKYFLVTLHREENVDVTSRLSQFIRAFDELAATYKMPIIISTHPRTRKRLDEYKLTPKNKLVQFLNPFGLFDFVHLEKNAYIVLSDSGTVQEECCIYNIPNVTLRDTTERPETVEVGSNILSGASTESIVSCVKTALSRKPSWQPPEEYMKRDVSDTVVNILLGVVR